LGNIFASGATLSVDRRNLLPIIRPGPDAPLSRSATNKNVVHIVDFCSGSISEVSEFAGNVRLRLASETIVNVV